MPEERSEKLPRSSCSALQETALTTRLWVLDFLVRDSFFIVIPLASKQYSSIAGAGEVHKKYFFSYIESRAQMDQPSD